jgi:hypothetical protein
MARPKGVSPIMPTRKTPARPECLQKLGLDAYTEYGAHWTEDALAIMEAAFCGAMRNAHPYLEVQ